MKNSISIALATYNGEKYLAEQLQSFCAQTRLPDELIVCDDCSNDETLKIIYAFKKQAPFSVKVYVNSNNLGYIQNFSKALSLCTGDIIFLSDQDDVWLPHKIEKMIQYFDLNPDIQLLVHDLDYCKEDLTPIGQTKIERMENIFDLNQSFVVGMATAIRRPFLRLCLPIPKSTRITHDLWLHKCAIAINKKKIIRESLALYRRHNLNVTYKDKLNVDFVTQPHHFKKNIRTKIKNVNKLKSILESFLEQSFIEWLQNNRELLVAYNYLTLPELENFLEKELGRLDCIRKRCSILSLSRLKRIRPIYGLYQKGDYDYFDGLRTAIGDFLPK